MQRCPAFLFGSELCFTLSVLLELLIPFLLWDILLASFVDVIHIQHSSSNRDLLDSSLRVAAHTEPAPHVVLFHAPPSQLECARLVQK